MPPPPLPSPTVDTPRVVTLLKASDQAVGGEAARAVPYVTLSLIVCNLVLFALMTAVEGGTEPSNEAYIAWGANFQPLTTGGEWWRLLTSAFLHFGWMHLVVNVWVLWEIGRLVERQYGHASFTLLYVFAAAMGGFASLFWNADRVIAAGASGAICGLYGALLAYLLIHRKTVAPRVLGSLVGSAVLFVSFTLLYGLSHSGIDNAAHAGGLLAGFALGVPLTRPVGSARGGGRRLALAATGALASVFLAGLLAPRPAYDIQAEKRFFAELDWFRQQEQTTNNRFNELIGKAREGSISNREFADALEADCLAPWRAIHDRFAELGLQPTSPSFATRKAIIEFAAIRRDGLIALIDGIRRQNRARVEEFRALQDQAEKLLEQMNKRVKP